MKEQWSINKEKFVALEEGLSNNGECSSQRSSENSGTCKQLMQCLKLILYVELTLFIGWACYTMWQTYQTQPIEVKVADITRGPQPQSIYNENAVLQASTVGPRRFGESESILKKFAEILKEEFAFPDGQKSREEISSVIKPDVSSNRMQTSDSETSWRRDPTLSGTSIDNEREEPLPMPVTDAVEIIEPWDETSDVRKIVSKEDSFESAQQEDDVLVWTFPFLWSIHGLKELDDLDRSGLKEQQLASVLGDEQSLMDSPSTADGRPLEEFASGETNPFDHDQNNPPESISSSTEDMMDQYHDESSKQLDWNVFADIVRRITIESDANHKEENVENFWDDQTIRHKPFLFTFQDASDKLISDESKSSQESGEREISRALPPRVFTWSDIEDDPSESSISSLSDSYTVRGIPTSYPMEMEDRQIVADSNEELETNEDELNSDTDDPKLHKFKVLKCTTEVINDSIVEKCELTDLSYAQEEFESHLHKLIDSVFTPDYKDFSHRGVRSLSSHQGSRE